MWHRDVIYCKYTAAVVMTVKVLHYVYICSSVTRSSLTDFTLFFNLSFSLRHAYENCTVLEARMCYDVARLMYLNSERYDILTLRV